MKKTLLATLPLLALLASCGGSSSSSVSVSEKPSSSETVIETSQTSSSSSSSSLDSSSAAEEYARTETIVFTGSIKESGGYGYHDHREVLAAYFDKIEGVTLSSSEGKITATDPDTLNDANPTLLCIGSAKAEGTLNFTFSKPVDKIVISASEYYKHYNSGTEMFNNDVSAVVIGEKSYELAHYSGTASVAQDVEEVFTTGVSTLSISNGSAASDENGSTHRFFLESISFSWKIA